MSNVMPSRKTVALILAIVLGVAPLMAANAAELPYTRLYRSLHVRAGVYYLVSPEIVASVTHGSGGRPGYNIDFRVKQVKLGAGYVMIYGEQETRLRRIELARENMVAIRSQLAAAVLAMPKGRTVDQLGFPALSYLITQASSMCRINFVHEPQSQLIVLTIGQGLSYAQFCVGLGIGAALAGYRIEPTRQGLGFRRMLDVKQGMALNGSRG